MSGILQPWERTAAKELASVLYELSYGCFETKASLAQRLRQAADEIELMGDPDIEPDMIVVIPVHRDGGV